MKTTDTKKKHHTMKKKTKRKSICKSAKVMVQNGRAPYRGRKVTLHDKIAKIIGTFMSGPAPTSTTAFIKFGNQAVLWAILVNCRRLI